MKLAKEKCCPDCGTGLGEFHAEGCDVEPCPYCGGQLLSCCCEGIGSDSVPADDRMPWDGFWPGSRACVQFGWFARMVREGDRKSWVPCGPDEPGAIPDLNRLHTEARWSRRKKRWVRRKGG
jgi:hypothetical protein